MTRWTNRTSHDELKRMIEHVYEMLHKIHEKELQMSAELDRLTASVAALTTAEQSLVTLVKGLAQLIRDNATDPAALTKLADDIDADTAEITTAVTENTPAP